MKNLKLVNLNKSFDSESIVKNINIEIPRGKFFALLGPSGCGKTTLLRMIAGFEQPDSGAIFLGDEDITELPVNHRSIHTIFQKYALFPNMNVFDNIAYSLKVKKCNKDEIVERVNKIVKIFNLENLVAKSIDKLSGGQQQRVAIARAVINKPDILLLDEPLSALDFKLREKILLELIDLQAQLGITFIYVTHDQTEALTVADKMAIMSYDGTIEQVGSPKEIYEFPQSKFVAEFVGHTNIFKGKIFCDNSEVRKKYFLNFDTEYNLETPDLNGYKNDNNDSFYLNIRPEKIIIDKKKLDNFSNSLTGIVKSIIYHGRSTQYNIKIKSDFIVQVFEQNSKHFEKEFIDYDDTVFIHWNKENSTLLRY